MIGSKLPYLDKINTIILAAGHGGGDSGAVNAATGFQETNDNIYLTDQIHQILRGYGLNVVVVPHELGLASSIGWVNARYKSLLDAWAIEIHRDGYFTNIPEDRRNNQMGVYYFGDPNGDNNLSDDDTASRAIADFLVEKFVEYGAAKGSTENKRDFDGSWSQDHYVQWSGFHLGWVQNTNTVAHLIECGYMSGRSDIEHLNKLAKWVANGIYEAFTGKVAPQSVAVPVTVRNHEKTKEDMFIENLKQEVIKSNIYDQQTKDTLVQAIHEGNASYINSYLGEIPRVDAKEHTKRNADLISEINTLQSTSKEAIKTLMNKNADLENVIEQLKRGAPANTEKNHVEFTPRSIMGSEDMAKQIDGLMKSRISDPKIAKVVNALFPEGRILGISKKLTALVPVQIISILGLAPVQYQGPILIATGLLTAGYLFLQSIIDYKK